MRVAVALALTVCLAACTPPRTTVYKTQLVSQAPAKSTAVRPGGQRLLAIERLYAICEHNILRLQVSASANTGGWTNPRLNRLSVEGNAPVYEVIAQPPAPGSMNTQALQMVTVFMEEPMPLGITKVRALAQTNEMSAAVFRGDGCR